MEPGYIDFKADLGRWKVSQKVEISNDFATIKDAWIIARATSGLEGVLEEALRVITDLKQVDAILSDAWSKGDAGNALTVLTTRKLGSLITQLSEQNGGQAKEKKEIQEMIKLYAARKILSHFGMELNYGQPKKTEHAGPISSGGVQLIANYPEWKCVKKFRVEETTNRRTVAELVTSYCITLDLRFEEYLHSHGKIDMLDSVLQKAPDKSASLNEMMTFLKSEEVNAAVQKTAATGGFSEYAGVLHAYAIRKVLKTRGLIVDYTQIKSLPGWKRVVGKRK
jgi:hypothetical protein